ncbi:hypothetical protein BDW69DRAFT_142018 [Aspergillus filifer]
MEGASPSDSLTIPSLFRLFSFLFPLFLVMTVLGTNGSVHYTSWRVTTQSQAKKGRNLARLWPGLVFSPPAHSPKVRYCSL